jgi:hypothetical protein
MQITLSLDDDVDEIVKDYAAVKNLDFSGAVSDLVRKSIEAPLSVRLVNGICVIDLPAGSPVINSERVRELLDKEF